VIFYILAVATKNGENTLRVIQGKKLNATKQVERTASWAKLRRVERMGLGLSIFMF
jgi:hypothetical protein